MSALGLVLPSLELKTQITKNLLMQNITLRIQKNAESNQGRGGPETRTKSATETGVIITQIWIHQEKE